MDAIVICGGQGTRVREITKDEIPKILIPVNGTPFLEHMIHRMYHYGVRRVVLAAGFRGPALKEYLERRRVLSSINPWMDISINIETEPLDTGGSVLNCLNRSGSGPHSEPFLIANGDSLIIPDKYTDSYEQLYYESNPYNQSDLSVFTCSMKHDGQYGSLVIDDDGLVSGFENDKKSKKKASFINCGWYIVRRDLFKKYHNEICTRDRFQIYDVLPMSLEKELFIDFLKEGNLINPVVIGPDEFLEIGTPEALEGASNRLKEL